MCGWGRRKRSGGAGSALRSRRLGCRRLGGRHLNDGRLSCCLGGRHLQLSSAHRAKLTAFWLLGTTMWAKHTDPSRTLRIVLVADIIRAAGLCRHRATLAAASSCARSFPAVPPPCTERRDQRLRARSFHFWEYLFLRPTGNASHITKVAGFGSAGNACRALREIDVPKTETNSASFSNTRGWRLSLAPSARPDQQRTRRGP